MMKNRKLINNFIYNTMYQVLNLIAPLITMPYISRILGATNIGIYQYSQSIASYFELIGAVGTALYGQREIAYLQDKPLERSKAFWEIEIFRLFTTALCTAFYMASFCINGTYSDIFFILTLEVCATAFDISWLFMGMENFKLIVLRNTIIKLAGIICVFLFVRSAKDLWLYTLCMTAPLFLGNLSLWFSLKKYVVKTELAFKDLFFGIKKRLGPILALFLPQVAADVYLLLDKTMIGVFGSSIDQVGYYSQGQKIIQIVLRIVTSLGAVMLPTMSAQFARGDLEGIRRSIRNAFQFVYLLSFPLLFGLCAVAPRFVPLFFGKGYGPVVPLMINISPVLVIIATSNVIGRQYLLPTNQQKAYTASILTGAGVNFILNMVLIHFWDAIGASIATVIAELSVTGVQCWYVRRQLPLRESMRSGIRYAVFSVVMFVGCRVLDSALPGGGFLSIAMIIVVGIMIYASELLVTRDPMLSMAISLIKRNE